MQAKSANQAPGTKLWRCRICSEAIISLEHPGSCPFCGAHKEWVRPAEDWKYPDEVKLSDKSRKNLEEALQIEISNTAFYLCVSRVSKDPFIQGMFKALSDVERQHAYLHARLLGAQKPVIGFDSKLCKNVDVESVKESLEREIKAVAAYGKFWGEAKEPRLKEVFKALVDIEGDHIALDRKVLGEMK